MSQLQNATRSERTHYTCQSNQSPMRGVHFDESKGRWRVMIRFQGRNFHLGRFRNIEDAARAYDSESRKLYGQFARTNFGREGLLPQWQRLPKPNSRRMDVRFARDEELERWISDSRDIDELPPNVQIMLDLYSELNLARGPIHRRVA